MLSLPEDCRRANTQLPISLAESQEGEEHLVALRHSAAIARSAAPDSQESEMKLLESLPRSIDLSLLEVRA